MHRRSGSGLSYTHSLTLSSTLSSTAFNSFNSAAAAAVGGLLGQCTSAGSDTRVDVALV